MKTILTKILEQANKIFKEDKPRASYIQVSDDYINTLYSEYCQDNIKQLKAYKKKHPNRMVKWGKLSKEDFIKTLIN